MREERSSRSGAFWFWALCAATVILLIIFSETAHVGFATLTMIATFALLAFFGDFNLLVAVREHPIVSSLASVGYVVCGVVWSFAKWGSYVRSRLRKLEEVRRHFLRDRGKPEHGSVPEDLRTDWRRHCHSYRITTPVAEEHKDRILGWLMYWPFSLVWTVINDPLKRLFQEIFHAIRAQYQRMADRIYRNVQEELMDPTEADEAIARGEVSRPGTAEETIAALHRGG